MTESKKEYPTAVYHMRLQCYNFKFFSLEEIVLFEYLVVKALHFDYEAFYHSAETIKNETGIKRTRLERAIEKFKDLGIINTWLEGMPQVRHFLVDFEAIQSLLPKIFKFDSLDRQFAKKSKLYDEFDNISADLYTKYAEVYIEKKNKKKIEQEKDKSKTLDRQEPGRSKEPDAKAWPAAAGAGPGHEFEPEQERVWEEEIFEDRVFSLIKSFIKRYEDVQRSIPSTAPKLTDNWTCTEISDKLIKGLQELIYNLNEPVLLRAWTAYCDAIIMKKESKNDLLYYFMEKDSEGKYHVVDRYFELFYEHHNRYWLWD